jgi:hypothetical protein
MASFVQTLKNAQRRLPAPVRQRLHNAVKGLTSLHRPSGEPNVFVFTMPRSGSTWLMELIWSQPGFRCVNEPLDVRNPLVRSSLGLSTWEALSQRDPQTLDKLERYFRGYCQGKIHVVVPPPWLNRHYRPVTHRIVFKVIHGGEDMISWFGERFNGRIVYFVRHPIPVSLSHGVFPRLQTLVSSHDHLFTAEQRREAERILEGGTKLERGVLDWCLQNLLPLQQVSPDWVVLSYEQLVLEPERAVPYLAERLALPDHPRIMAHLAQASGVLRKSDPETQRLLTQGQERSKLVSKWRNRVSEDEEAQLMAILERFGIDAYRAGSLLPAPHLWLGEARESFDVSRAAPVDPVPTL